MNSFIASSAKESSDVSEDFQSTESNVVDGYEEKKPITPEPILSEKTNNKLGQQKEVYSKSIIWTGTVSEAEEQFTTDNINGIDTVKDIQSKIPFTGKMQILNEKGIRSKLIRSNKYSKFYKRYYTPKN